VPRGADNQRRLLAEAAATCACLNFRKASRAVTQLFDEVLRPSGLRSTQFVILVGIYLYGPVTSSDLARDLVMDRSSLTRNLRPLLSRRLVRHVQGKDRRKRPLSLTPRGKSKMLRAVPLWEQAQGRFVRQLGSQRWGGLARLLDLSVTAARRG
jgi:DNA-binding MarR family transcriptional regulator